ncbi:hypothetical protein TIFTF001_030556 [Ficus carica]|uniref:Uncharacterized protein n=1 Tax=Ficus carica TaxID=3494 RepID=A0AA88DUE2_FICCA|nr:hypothetical protein TIFTF001_030556 [Ficus carica]
MASVVVIVLTQPPPWRPTFSLHSLSLNSPPPPFSFPSRRSYSAAYRRWDSNTDTPRFGFGFKPKPKPDDDEDDDYQEEEEEEEFYRTNRKKRRWWFYRRVLISKFKFLQVFKSYGWMLPIILISWLLATGPKALLMALALPLGQSALSLAFDKLWGGTQSRPKRRRRMRKRQSASAATDAAIEEEEDELREPGKAKMGYQSWVVGNEGSVKKGGQKATTFGGWDDLERVKSAQRQSRRTGGPGRTETEKGKLSRRESKSDTPLLLRLLIAFFPFLGSWTKMLW